ncbi:MAG TPA: ribonuclease E activity regulator RraA [Burkholderiaceae bacterium]|nr:ribonuclease E activity regulator RraA [Burkholderiaceae bacterium]
MNPLSTCDLCDEHRNDPPDRFRVLPPVFRDYGARMRFHGVVATVQCFEDNTSVRAAVQAPGQGRVLVVDGGGSLRRALLGGNLAAAAEKNGWAGVVVDGAVRDVEEMARCQIGIRALGLMPMATDKRHAGLTDGSIHVSGVWVHPGEWLVADEDGIVVMAAALR